jgi:hypothetical protein
MKKVLSGLSIEGDCRASTADALDTLLGFPSSLMVSSARDSNPSAMKNSLPLAPEGDMAFDASSANGKIHLIGSGKRNSGTKGRSIHPPSNQSRFDPATDLSAVFIVTAMDGPGVKTSIRLPGFKS